MYEPTHGGIEHGPLSGGARGTAETVMLMRRLIREGKVHPVVRAAAVRVIDRAGVASHDLAGQVLALYRYVRDSIRFVRDPRGIEWLQSPRWTLLVGGGDCDDKTTLLVALADSLGLPVDWRLRVIGTDPSRPRAFTHIYPVAFLGAQRLALDPTHRGTPAGWEFATPSRIAEVAL